MPFTRSEFVQVFAAYNQAIWPLQVIAALLGLVAIALLFWRPAWADRVVAAILSMLWLLTGAGYHWFFFAAINDVAYAFGGLFILAAILILVEGAVRNRIQFAFVPGFRSWLAMGFIIYSFVLYPLIGLFATHPYPETPLFGVVPCPTAIFTLALLMLSEHPRPLLLAAVPLIWSVTGGSAAILLDVPQDFALFAALPAWMAGYLTRRGARHGRKAA